MDVSIGDWLLDDSEKPVYVVNIYDAPAGEQTFEYYDRDSGTHVEVSVAEYNRCDADETVLQVMYAGEQFERTYDFPESRLEPLPDDVEEPIVPDGVNAYVEES